jgi:hypothetical protein
VISAVVLVRSRRIVASRSGRLRPLDEARGRDLIRSGSFTITKNEIEQVNYRYVQLNEPLAKYPPAKMKEGWNIMPDGEEVFFISTPSSGLWATQSRRAQ